MWFDTGLKMADKKTPRTMEAIDEAQEIEYFKKGWKPLSQKKAGRPKQNLVKPSDNITKSK